MIALLHRAQIQDKAWDDCVRQAQLPLPYAETWYLDVVSPGWAGVVKRGAGKSYEAVLPLPLARSYGITYIKQPLFAQQLGFFSREPLTSSEQTDFLSIVQKQYAYIADYAFNTQDGLFGGLPGTPHQTHYLPLSRPYADLRRGYRADRRARLRQASGNKMVQAHRIDALAEMFRCTAAKGIQGGVSPKAYALLRRLFAAAERRACSQLYYTLDRHGTPEAGAWFLFGQRQIIYLFNAAWPAARKNNGRSFILDQIIQQYAQTPYVLDFESAQLAQIADFYVSFGSQAMPFWQWHHNALPPWINALKGFRARWRA